MAEPTPLVGRRLGEFEVLERVAAGGFGEVFRARQTTLHRDAVIKVLASNIVGTARERFTREAQLASQLDHPYAAHIYAFGVETDGLQWIAMELVRGISLAELLKAQGPLPVARFVPLFQAICQVVQVAHEQGIVHRDIKPANVMVVARAGVLLPKLLDFGIARLYTADAGPEIDQVEQRVDKLLDEAEGKQGSAAATADTQPDHPEHFDSELEALLGSRLAQIASTPRDRTDLTSGGMYLGSPPYMAPELWLRPHAAGPPCDIYALGIVAFECVTGRQPYTGERLTDIARAHLGPLPSLGPHVPPALHDVLAKAVSKKAKERLPDALALARAVEAACRVEAFAQLPRPPSDLVAGVLARAPQPIAETLAAADGSTRAEDAHARYVVLGELVAQLVGVLAFASWCRLGKPEGDGAIRALVRRLCKTGFAGADWLDLAAAVTKPFARLRDAFPLPELVDICAAPSDALRAVLAAPRDVAQLPALVEGVSKALADIGDLFEYDLVVGRDRGCESWTGARRRPRLLVEGVGESSDGSPLRDGEPLLLDKNRAPVLSLWPLAKAIAPTATADPELFVVAGLGRYGARLVAQPYGFERQDAELAAWLEEIAGETGAAGADDQEERAPYRGLASFSVDESEFFFGRERESENLANHLRARAFSAVVGPSGAGKSSYVQAGVLPLLPKDWRAVVLRPGATPLAAMFARLAPLGLEPIAEGDRKKPQAIVAWLEREARRRGETLVLYIDQSEELVTLCRDEEERAAYGQVLAGVRDDERVRVVMTMRDDFLMRLQRVPGLGERLTSGIHLLGTPSRADLRRILVEPARRLGYAFEDERLVDEMVDAVADNPSALALLSFTAARLWELRDRQFKKLRRKVYTSIGGVGGALAQHAEDVIVRMSPEERELVREAFRHLVTADGTRAVIAKSELAELLGGGEHAARVIESLVDARLAVTTEAAGGVTVEITHEALLESWPRLVTWRREDAEHARLRDQLRTAARQWEARGRDRGVLWRGDVLVEYRLWRSRYRGRMSELEEEFGAACLREHSRGIRTRRVLLSAAFAALGATAVVLYLFAARARTSAADATRKTIALLEEEGRRELLDHHPLRAAKPLARAYSLGGEQSSLRFLLSNAMASVESQGAVLTGHDGFVRRAYFSNDGASVITTGDDGTVRAWDAKTGREVQKLALAGSLRAARSRDGELIAIAAKDEVRVLHTRDLSAVAAWKLAPSIRPVSIAIADNGKRVIVGDGAGTVHVLVAGTATDAATARHKAPVQGVAISADGEIWASGGDDGHVEIIHGDQVEDLVHGAKGVYSLAITADGSHVASGGRDGVVKVWSTAGGEMPLTLSGHAAAVRSLAFTTDGTHLASASEDTTVRLWSLGAEDPPRVLAGHEGQVFSCVFDRAERQLVTASSDGTVRVWDLASGVTVASLDAHTAESWFADFDATGERVASAGFDQTARVWNVPRRDRRIEIPAGSGALTGASFDRAGDRIATAGRDGVARVFTLAGQQLAAITTKPPLRAIALSPDGTLVVSGSEAGVAMLARVDDPQHPTPLDVPPGKVLVARFRPDGRELVLGCEDGVARIYDPTGKLVRELRGHTAAIWGAGYSRDGTLLATTSDDKMVRIWDAASGGAIRTLGPQSAEVNAVDFDASRTRIATASQDGMLRVYRLDDGTLLAETAAHHDNIVSIAFSNDGERIATASFDHTVVVWDASTLEALARLARHTAAVLAVTYRPGTDFVLSTGDDGALWLTDLGLEKRSPTEISRIVRP
jgi:WD40 repeat protein/serine/threonine protein kinase